MSYKPRSFFSLVQDINKSVFLPHIQRPFVWDEEQILRLFDSLMRNYPFQTFLFWRTDDEIKARRFMNTIEWDAPLSEFYDKEASKKNREKVFVLDGQQRIQSLFAIFTGGINSQNGTENLDAYFDVTSGHSKDKNGFMFSLQFFNDEQQLPYYKISNLLGKHEKRNPEDLADEINEELDTVLIESDNDKKK